MKTFDKPLSAADTRPEALGARPGAVAIIASATLIEGLPADAAVPAALLKGVDLLVLEVAAGSAPSLDRMARIRESHPGLAIIPAVENADVALVRSLLRQGVADVAELPFAAPALAAQVAEAAARGEGKVSSAERLAPMITVAGSLGGCGATTIIPHLAAALARQGGARRVSLLC